MKLKILSLSKRVKIKKTKTIIISKKYILLLIYIIIPKILFSNDPKLCKINIFKSISILMSAVLRNMDHSVYVI